MIKKNNKLLGILMLSVLLGISPVLSHIKAQATDNTFGVQNAKRLDSDYVDSCVRFDIDNSGAQIPKRVSSRDHCDNNEDGYALYYQRLYSDSPTFTVSEHDDSPLGFFTLPDGYTSIPGDFSSIYMSGLDSAISFRDFNTISDENLLYYKLTVNEENMRTQSNQEGSHDVYIPLFSKQPQFIPPIGDWINSNYTSDIIDSRNIGENINISFVEQHSQYAPVEGVEQAINKKSNKEYSNPSASSQKKEEPSPIVSTVTQEPSEKRSDDQEVKSEPLTLADFKWVFIILGIGVGSVALVSAVIIGSRALSEKNNRDAEQEAKRKEEEARISSKKRIWNNAVQQIDSTMADYGQKNADIANKTLFYPLIDDITHPFHIKFLRQMEEVEYFKNLSFSETRVKEIEDFSQEFSNTWNEFFSIAQEIGIPWVQTQEDKDRAVKLLNIILDDSATDNEREVARDNLIKHIDNLFAKEQEGKSLRFSHKDNKKGIYDKYDVKPNNLKISIHRSLSKPLHEITQQNQLAIEGR